MASLLIYITVVLSNIITSETVATPAIAGIEEAPTAGAAIIKVKIHHAVYYSSLRFKRCRVSEVVLNWLSPVYSTTNTTAQCRQYTWGGGTGGGCECVQKGRQLLRHSYCEQTSYPEESISTTDAGHNSAPQRFARLLLASSISVSCALSDGPLLFEILAPIVGWKRGGGRLAYFGRFHNSFFLNNAINRKYKR